jgi:hypothetical protein
MKNITIEQKEKIDNLISYGYDLNVGSYIKQAFRMYLKYFWGFIGITAIVTAIGFLDYFPHNSIWGNSEIFKHLELFVLAPIIGALTSIFYAGYNFGGQKIYFNQKHSFEDFFRGTNYWKDLALAYVIYYALYLIFIYIPGHDSIYIILLKITGKNLTPENSYLPFLSKNLWLGIIFIIVGIYFSVSFKWVQQLIIFYNMNFYEAMLYSLRLITKRWFAFLFFLIEVGAILFVPLIIVTLILAISTFYILDHPFNHHIYTFPNILIFGIFAIIWLFILIPVFYLSVYAAFEDVVGSKAVVNEELTIDNVE